MVPSQLAFVAGTSAAPRTSAGGLSALGGEGGGSRPKARQAVRDDGSSSLIAYVAAGAIFSQEFIARRAREDNEGRRGAAVEGGGRKGGGERAPREDGAEPQARRKSREKVACWAPLYGAPVLSLTEVK